MHPIVAQIDPSDEQLPAVTAGATDIVMTAGAGTGKTRTLVARALYLLAGGLELRRLIAITFTVKAASEMRNRLRREIQTYLARTDLDRAERARWEEIAAGMDAARIGTIHSLCTEILRNHPVEAAVDPRFAVLDEAQSALLVQEAIDEAVRWAANDASAVEVFQLFTPNALHALLEGLMSNRLKARPLLARRPWAEWAARTIAELRERALDDPALAELLDDLVALRESGAIAHAAGQGDDLAADLLRLLDGWDAAQTAAAQGDLATLVAQLRLLRTLVKGNRGRAPLWKPAAAPKATVSALRTYYDEVLKPLLEDASPTLDAQLAAGMPAVERIFSTAIERYAAAKLLRSALDFDDLEQRALDLLDGNPAVLARWRQATGALLVDEFQDTNDRQRTLVRLLGGQRGVIFLVGDAKQSIYRFRGAEVQVFMAEHARIKAGEGEALALRDSYRTHARLLHGLNALMAQVMGPADAPRPPFRAEFVALRPKRNASAHGLQAPFIEL